VKKRVERLLQEVAPEEISNSDDLMDFEPPPKPELSKVKEGNIDTSNMLGNKETFSNQPDTTSNMMRQPPPVMQAPSPADEANRATQAGMGGFYGGANLPSNYWTAYDQGQRQRYPQREGFRNAEQLQQPNFLPFGAVGQSVTSDGMRDKILEKLNYMIHLLEEQQDQKTGHVMEELILYSFLGVFMIFIVDSFARAGKYTR
jgi:hypothetical protein